MTELRAGQHVRITAPYSTFFGQRGTVVRCSPPGSVDPAYSVVCNDAPPMIFRAEEIEVVGETVDAHHLRVEVS